LSILPRLPACAVSASPEPSVYKCGKCLRNPDANCPRLTLFSGRTASSWRFRSRKRGIYGWSTPGSEDRGQDRSVAAPRRNGSRCRCQDRRGSPWENGYIESFNARLRIELLNGEIFYTLREAQIIIESPARHFKGCTYMLVGG